MRGGAEDEGPPGGDVRVHQCMVMGGVVAVQRGKLRLFSSCQQVPQETEGEDGGLLLLFLFLILVLSAEWPEKKTSKIRSRRMSRIKKEGTDMISVPLRKNAAKRSRTSTSFGH